jgi:hypothetical protein
MTHLGMRGWPEDVTSFARSLEHGICGIADHPTPRFAYGQTFSTTRPANPLINMSKICLPLLDLQRRALAEIRRMPGCHNVQEIAINRVTVEAVDFNWSLCVLSSGTADANTAARAAIHVQSALRRDYDLLID